MDKALITDALRAAQSRDGLDNSIIESLPDDLKAKVIGTRLRNSTITTVAALILSVGLAVGYVVSAFHGKSDPEAKPAPTHTLPATNQSRAPGD